MVKPPEEVNRLARTVIEAADPALQPVAKLRRFVIKRLDFGGSPPAEQRAKPRKAATARGTSRRQTSRSTR